MYENPLLYVRQITPQSTYIEHESTSVFEPVVRPPLIVRQLQFLQQQRRTVTLLLVKHERIIGTIMRLEAEHVWIMTDNGAICVSYNTIRAVQ